MICRPPAFAARSTRVALVVLAVALGGRAFGGTLRAPALKPGQFVYTIPEGFVPDKLSVSGLREIQSAAAALHYPFYIVFVRNLPTKSGSSTDDDTEDAIVGLAEDWSRDPNFNRQRSTVYLVSYGPGDRKYKMLPAPLWRSKLGLEYDALQPYNAIFRSKARQDPQSALIETMQTFDRDVFENFDPKRLAQRAAAERKRKEAEAAQRRKREAEERKRQAVMRLSNAESRVSMGMQRLKEVVHVQSGYDPNQTIERYKPLLEEGQEALAKRDTATLESVAYRLEGETGRIQAFNAQKQAEIDAAETRRNFTIAGIVGVIALALFGVFLRLRAIKRDRERLAAQVAEWRNWIQQARQRYYLFDENRDRAPHLRKFGGKTRELYESTSHEIDDIIVGVEAVARLLDEAEKGARHATFVSRAPLDRALTSLDAPFDFETAEISDKLFEPVAKTIRITPTAFLANLSQRYDAAVANWKSLNDAVTTSLELPDALFPHTGLDALLEKAEKHGLPDRWLASHPLIGDDESDRSLYARVNECRLEDPYAYALQIEELRQKETQLGHDLDRIIAALALATSHRVEKVTGLETTVLHPEDDPQITLDSANQERDRLPLMLQTADTVEAIEEQARTADGLYLKCAGQIATARDAIERAGRVLGEIDASLRRCTELQRRTAARLEQTAAQHRNVGAIQRSFSAAQQFFEAGLRDLSRAQGKFTENRHLGALRDAKEAETQFNQATERLNVTLQGCAELDAQRDQYMRMLSGMQMSQEAALRRVRQYNGSVYSIRGFQSPGPIVGPVDYAYLYGILLQQQRDWDTAVRAAERAYEEEQRRRREAEEAERRQRESWSSSSFGSSGSSGSSFSSGGSGSSGGSFSSGGSGSDGGSW